MIGSKLSDQQLAHQVSACAKRSARNGGFAELDLVWLILVLNRVLYLFFLVNVSLPFCISAITSFPSFGCYRDCSCCFKSDSGEDRSQPSYGSPFVSRHIEVKTVVFPQQQPTRPCPITFTFPFILLLTLSLAFQRNRATFLLPKESPLREIKGEKNGPTAATAVD